MQKPIIVSFLATLAVLAIPTTHLTATQITMSWSPVVNPNNAPDPTTGYGAVNYSYNIGTYDVTASQYVAFLNCNDPTGANRLSLYFTGMSNPFFGGVNFNSSAPAGQMYSVIPGSGNHPANWVSWYDAIRFANWMDNGQVPGATETGAYTLLGDTPIPSNALTITRNPGATIFLPTEDEWYKAAYYNPATSSYFLYPSSSNSAPAATSPTAIPNSANYYGGPNNLTDVGAYTETTSPNGAFDMGGDVWQWDETLIDSIYRGNLGGSFISSSLLARSSVPGSLAPTSVYDEVGFRLASISPVPEPSTAVLALLCFGVALWWRWRFKRSATSLLAFGASTTGRRHTPRAAPIDRKSRFVRLLAIPVSLTRAMLPVLLPRCRPLRSTL